MESSVDYMYIDVYLHVNGICVHTYTSIVCGPQIFVEWMEDIFFGHM